MPLSDAEIEALEAKSAPPKGLSDQDIEAMEAKAAPAPPPAEPGIGEKMVSNVADQLRAPIDGPMPIGSSIPILGRLAEKGGAAVGAAMAAGIYPRDKSWGEYYDQLLADNDARKAEFADKHPMGNVLSQLAGSATVPVAPTLKAAEGAGVLAKAGVAGLNSAGRVLTNTGLEAGDAYVKGKDPLEAAERAASVSGVIEGIGLGGKAFKSFQPAAQATADAIAEPIERAAARKATKAAFGHTPDFDKLRDPEATGRQLLDNDIVTFGASPATIAERAKTARGETGKKIGALLGEIDEKTPNLASGKSIADQVRAYVQAIKAPNNASIVENLEHQADEFEKMGDIPLAEAQRLKDLYKWDARDPRALSLGKEATNELKGIIGKEMQGAVGRSDSVAQSQAASQFGENVSTGTGQNFPVSDEGVPVLREATEAASSGLGVDGGGTTKKAVYDHLRKKYGAMASTAAGAERNAKKFAKQRGFSLTDYLATIGGAAALGHHGGLPAAAGGLAIGVANKVARERGNAAIASGLNNAASALKATPAVVGALGTAATGLAERGSLAVTNSLVNNDPLTKLQERLSQSPESLGRYAGQLADAAKRGNQALAVTHFMLSQTDPDYAQTVNGK